MKIDTKEKRRIRKKMQKKKDAKEKRLKRKKTQKKKDAKEKGRKRKKMQKKKDAKRKRRDDGLFFHKSKHEADETGIHNAGLKFELFKFLANSWASIKRGIDLKENMKFGR